MTLRESYEQAVRAANEKNDVAVKLGEKHAKEIAANEAYVAQLDAKADLLRRIELETVAKRDELALVQQTIDNLKSALAALKAGIPT